MTKEIDRRIEWPYSRPTAYPGYDLTDRLTECRSVECVLLSHGFEDLVDDRPIYGVVPSSVDRLICEIDLVPVQALYCRQGDSRFC